MEDSQASGEARPLTPDSALFVGESYKEDEERASPVVSVEEATGEKVVQDEVRHVYMYLSHIQVCSSLNCSTYFTDSTCTCMYCD